MYENLLGRACGLEPGKRIGVNRRQPIEHAVGRSMNPLNARTSLITQSPVRCASPDGSRQLADFNAANCLAPTDDVNGVLWPHRSCTVPR